MSIALRILLLAGLAVSVSPAQALKQEKPPLPPPYEGVYQPKGVDEIGLWDEADASEKRLANSSVLVRDEKLHAYLKDLLCRTVGSDRCSSVRLYVIREPVFNATMQPNGIMRIFTGLLLRCRNEAELAAVLGHEFGHFEKRHSLNYFKKHRSSTDLLSWAAVLAATAATYGSRIHYNNTHISVYGDLYRYGRNQEREADLLGLAYLNNSEMRPQAASEVWQNLIREAEASAEFRGLKKPKYDKIAFFASHPPKGERAVYLDALADPEAKNRDDGKAAYRAAIAPFLPMMLEDQIKLNDFGASEYIINSLAADGWTADLWFARGELYRLRGNLRDHVNAASFYKEAIELSPDMALAYRGRGLSLIKTGERTEGQAALSRYLELAPDAQDAGMIRMLVPSTAQKEDGGE